MRGWHRKVFEMRQAGHSFADIARTFDISTGHASQIYKSAEKQIALKEIGLSARAYNVLVKRFGAMPTPAEVAKLSQWELLKEPRAGWKTVNEITKWVAANGCELPRER